MMAENAEVRLPEVSVDDLCRMIGDRDIQVARLQMLAQQQANELAELKASSVTTFDGKKEKAS